ncbi:low temperature requirement protein A [Agrococcus sp. Marseille-P2731]|uniref:low temperature requirement protein A n=1 Tax=Agrococcus sp. Marseille-P2731 TaxID=1841862 RepID=UPI000930AE5D|nr:low temperature requirement protein A [Agrococcus sp. Marseille-P2731]
MSVLASTRRLVPMLGRDPHEPGRAATPLELLFDLAFVAAFGIAGGLAAHAFAAGHVGAALSGFAFAVFAITWAWINFTWFASAFDTDDWWYRLTTMLQMTGVVVLALGLSDVFHSLEEGHYLDNRVMVAGYVVMRVAMLVQWVRLALQNPQLRRTALTYAGCILLAQLGWVALAIAHLELLPTALHAGALYAVELGGPLVAERGTPTPWHPHHIAERYGLLAIITLGEGVLGTIAAVQPVIERQGWSVDAIVIVGAGTVLTFGMWWLYFAAPFGEMLHRRPRSTFLFGYGHMLVFGAIAAVGAGLHVAAYVIEGESAVGYTGAVAVTAVPVAVFLIIHFAIAAALSGGVRPLDAVLLVAALAVLALGVAVVAGGAAFIVGILVITAAPWLVVLGTETLGRSRA